MKSNVIVILTFLFSLGEINGHIRWAVYDGTHVPDDAVKAGVVTGADVYIARTVGRLDNSVGLVPSHFYPKTGSIKIVLGGGVITRASEIEILCADSEDDFQWIQTSDNNIKYTLMNYNPVIGGQQHISDSIGDILLIGRVTKYDELFVGKIDSSSVLYFESLGTSDHETKYEVLMHKN